jgi:ribonuclease HII
MTKSKYQKQIFPSFEYESEYRTQGIGLIAGIDEVGMGALAGPVVAGAVMFEIRNPKTLNPKQIINSKFKIQNEIVIRDSKAMTAKQREEAVEWIKTNALAWAVGEASVEEIDTINIRQASHLAMRRAVDALSVMPGLLLIDGNPAQPHTKIPAVNIIKGDQLCYSIAAASIVAKVYRDKMMENFSRRFPGYDWESNKGYGSLSHKNALLDKGITVLHRKSYAPVAALAHKQYP